MLAVLLLVVRINVVQAATYVVRTEADMDPFDPFRAARGSLREVIGLANANPGLDRIEFNIPSFFTEHVTISVTRPLPTITGPVTIDGTTQPGWRGEPLVVIDGSLIPSGEFFSQGMLEVIFAGGTTVRGLVLNGSPFTALAFLESPNSVVENCYIGTNEHGTAAKAYPGAGALFGPFGPEGIVVTQSADVRIGGTLPNTGNVISGNGGDGITLSLAPRTIIQGNMIGTDRFGQVALGNSGGIYSVNGSHNCLIGGTSEQARNVISGNQGTGIFVNGDSGTRIQGNFIGTDRTGTIAVPNGADGIRLQTGQLSFPKNHIIGGTAAGARNVISGNGDPGQTGGDGTSASGKSGIVISGGENNQILGNFIGVDVTGTRALGKKGAGVLFVGGSSDEVPSIGNQIGGSAPGVGNVISGNGLGEGWSGIYLFGLGFETRRPSRTLIAGNFVGTDVTGTIPLGNGGSGVQIQNSPDNQVGGSNPGERNIISGNGVDGIAVLNPKSTGNVIQGNYVGLDVSGGKALANGRVGVLVSSIGTAASASRTTIGGTAPGAGNVISGNPSGGVRIVESTATGNVVQGNWIGTDATGTKAVGNGISGVFIRNAPGNLIGGTAPGTGNLISGNTAGIIVNEPQARGNPLRGNVIFGNAQLGIDLGDNGRTLNDAGDVDEGANRQQNFPTLTLANKPGSVLKVIGELARFKPGAYQVEFFANAACDPSGNGEGERFLGSELVTTDSLGNGSFTKFFPGAVVSLGHAITATATDAEGNTSEFSACVGVTALNGSPQGQPDSLGATENQSSEVAIAKLLGNDIDLDGDALTLSVTENRTVQGGTIVMSGALLRYPPPAGFVGEDSFVYRVTDGNGGEMSVNVKIIVAPANRPTRNLIRLTFEAGGGARLRFIGLPNRPYAVQVSEDLVNWTAAGRNDAGPNGEFEFLDLDAPRFPTRYYRLVAP